MEIVIKKVEGVTVLQLSGYMVEQTKKTYKNQMEKILEQGNGKIIFDLENIQTIDSSGFGTIVFMSKKCRGSGGDLKIVSMKDHIKKIFRDMRLDKIIDVFPSVADALEDFELNKTTKQMSSQNLVEHNKP